MTKHYDPAAVAALVDAAKDALDLVDIAIWIPRHAQSTTRQLMEAIDNLKPTEPAPDPSNEAVTAWQNRTCAEIRKLAKHPTNRAAIAAVADGAKMMRGYPTEPAPASRWVRLAKVSNSGCVLYVCTVCGRESKSPDKTCGMHARDDFGNVIDCAMVQASRERINAALKPTEPAPASAGLSDGVRAALIDLREKNQRLPFDAVDDELGRIIAMLDYQPAASAGLLAAAELVWQTIPAEHDGPQAQTHARALTHLRDAIAAEKARKPMLELEEHNSVFSAQLDYYKSDLDRIRSSVDPDDDSDEKTADLVVSTIADLRERLARAAPASVGLLEAAEEAVRQIPLSNVTGWVRAPALKLLRDAIAVEKARKPDDRDATIADLRERLAKAEAALCDRTGAVRDVLEIGPDEPFLLGVEAVRRRLASLLERAEKAESQMRGVMHFVDKWFDDGRSMPDDPAQRANEAREIALQAIERAEANSGAAALRRLRDDLTGSHDWVSDKDQKWGLARAIQHVDRLLAEIEQPAAEEPQNERPVCEACTENPAVHVTAEAGHMFLCDECRTTIVEDLGGAAEPQEREGDDVLRYMRDKFCEPGVEDEHMGLTVAEAVDELCRRALGGGA